MTVDFERPDGGIVCRWVDDERRVRVRPFDPDLLMQIDPRTIRNAPRSFASVAPKARAQG